MKRSEKIKVTLRKKPISNGKRISLYLDYYPPLYDAATGESTRREFLKLYLIARPANAFDKLANEEVLNTAKMIQVRRQNELFKDHIGYTN